MYPPLEHAFGITVNHAFDQLFRTGMRGKVAGYPVVVSSVAQPDIL